ncbi:MAG TPA: M48 family metallopeptidase [Jiangellaceae bacterium]|nr:M48 family metallopeptidase [Jiangellaceae bacterium]
MPETTVEIRRSRRRKRTVTAFREAGKVVVCMPATFTKAQEQQWVSTMLKRLDAADARRRPSDDRLLARAWDLSRRYLDGRAEPASVRWSANQNSRWGSCTPDDTTIRVSDRLKGVPPWVLDYVLVHELAHLLVADHGEEFWALVNRYPRTDRARGFLDGLTHAAGRPPDDAEAL